MHYSSLLLAPLLIALCLSLSGCPVVRATGDSVKATGEGVGHAVVETGEGVGHAVVGTGEAVGRAGHELAPR